MRWELGNVKFHQMIELKKMPKNGKEWIEKDGQKGKILNWKRCPKRENIELKNMPKKEKIEMRKSKMVYLFINLPI